MNFFPSFFFVFTECAFWCIFMCSWCILVLFYVFLVHSGAFFRCFAICQMCSLQKKCSMLYFWLNWNTLHWCELLKYMEITVHVFWFRLKMHWTASSVNQPKEHICSGPIHSNRSAALKVTSSCPTEYGSSIEMHRVHKAQGHQGAALQKNWQLRRHIGLEAGAESTGTVLSARNST